MNSAASAQQKAALVQIEEYVKGKHVNTHKSSAGVLIERISNAETFVTSI